MTEYITEWYWDERRNAPNQDQREEIVRCRDCKHATISTMGVCKYCEMFVLPDTDGYGADAQVNLPLDFFCAWGEKRTNE